VLQLLEQDPTFPEFLVRAPMKDQDMTPMCMILFTRFCCEHKYLPTAFPTLVAEYLDLISICLDRPDFSRFFSPPTFFIWTNSDYTWPAFPGLLRSFEDDVRSLPFSLELARYCVDSVPDRMLSSQNCITAITRQCLSFPNVEIGFAAIQLFVSFTSTLPEDRFPTLDDLPDLMFEFIQSLSALDTLIFDRLWSALCQLTATLSGPYVAIALDFLQQDIPISSCVAIFNFLTFHTSLLSLNDYMLLIRYLFILEAKQRDETLVSVFNGRWDFPEHGHEIIALIVSLMLEMHSGTEDCRSASFLLLRPIIQEFGDVISDRWALLSPVLEGAIASDDIEICQSGVNALDFLLTTIPTSRLTPSVVNILWCICARHNDQTHMARDILCNFHGSAHDTFSDMSYLLSELEQKHGFAASHDLLPLWLHLLALSVTIPTCLPSEQLAQSILSSLSTLPPAVQLWGSEVVMAMYTRSPELFSELIVDAVRYIMEAIGANVPYLGDVFGVLLAFLRRLKQVAVELIRPYYDVLVSHALHAERNWWAFFTLTKYWRWDPIEPALAEELFREFMSCDLTLLDPSFGMLAFGLRHCLPAVLPPPQAREFIAYAIEGLRTLVKIPHAVNDLTRLLRKALKRGHPEDIESFGQVFLQFLATDFVQSHMALFVDTLLEMAGILVDHNCPAFHMFFVFLHRQLLGNQFFWLHHAINWFVCVMRCPQASLMNEELDMMCRWARIGFSDGQPEVLIFCYRFIEAASARDREYGLSWLPELLENWPTAQQKPALANCLWQLFCLDEDIERDEGLLIEMVKTVPLSPEIAKTCDRVMVFCERNAGRYLEFQYYCLRQFMTVFAMHVWSVDVSPFGRDALELMFGFCRKLLVGVPTYFERMRAELEVEPMRFARLMRMMEIEL
jgi:hypothetical protein